MGTQLKPDLGSSQTARGRGPFFSSTGTQTKVLGGFGCVAMDRDPGAMNGSLTVWW